MLWSYHIYGKSSLCDLSFLSLMKASTCRETSGGVLRCTYWFSQLDQLWALCWWRNPEIEKGDSQHRRSIQPRNRYDSKSMGDFVLLCRKQSIHPSSKSGLGWLSLAYAKFHLSMESIQSLQFLLKICLHWAMVACSRQAVSGKEEILLCLCSNVY